MVCKVAVATCASADGSAFAAISPRSRALRMSVERNASVAPTRVDLAPWPAIKAYHERLRTRPKLARAFQEEMALYQAELARHKAA